MTLLSTQVVITYQGDGASTAFPIPFPFYGNDELSVIETVTATGVETTKALNSDYSVVGGNGSTGTVTASVAPSAAVKWSIKRNTDLTQETDYTPNDPFPAETHELALDKLTAIAQELKELLGRTVTVSIASGLVNIQIPPPGAGLFWRWNAAGTAIEAVPITGTGSIGIPVTIAEGGTNSTTVPGAIDNFGIAGTLIYLWENFR